MKEEEIIKLIEDLDWNLPEKTQYEAMRKLMKIDEESCHLLVQKMKKNTWLNATRIIMDLGYPFNRKALPSLIWLLQDLNWPGVTNAFESLKIVDKKAITPLLEKCIKEAFEGEDFMWLGGIKYFVEEAEIAEEDFENKGIFDLLSCADCDYSSD